MFVGSSNLSKSALTSGIEWNLAVEANVSPATFEDAQNQFIQLFYHGQTVSLNAETCRFYEQEYVSYYEKNPQIMRDWHKTEEIDMMIPQEEAQLEAREPDGNEIQPVMTSNEIVPRPAQSLALEELEKTVDEGYTRALVVMATGLGKTYLAAFFARNYQKVLFIAHREELLHQAKRSFQTLMPERTTGIYNALHKEKEADSVFASIYTLSMKKHLELFQPDEFDLIVMDEFHHAAAQSYQRVLDYFRPRFLLGITATPNRTDGKDVFAICEGNVAYQIDFIEAIQNGWLSPFKYYGVYDETDYSQLTWLGTRYDEAELLAVQLKEEMAEKIFEAWKKHKQTRTLAFCSSIRQADFLANFFEKKGILAISLHSYTKEISRVEAIRRMEEGSIEMIFTVDLFDEGTDIPSVDTLFICQTD